MEHYILESNVLGLHIQFRNEVLINPVDGTNKALRHGAYRQYIVWQYGRLGEGIRKVIPSCAFGRSVIGSQRPVDSTQAIYQADCSDNIN